MCQDHWVKNLRWKMLLYFPVVVVVSTVGNPWVFQVCGQVRSSCPQTSEDTTPALLGESARVELSRGLIIESLVSSLVVVEAEIPCQGME